MDAPGPIDSREKGSSESRVLEGELGLGTFSKLLRRLHEERSTGVLRVAVGGAERRVYLRWGFVIFAASELIADRLDRRLLADGKVSSSSLLLAHEEQKTSGKRFGESLVALGAITEAELAAAVERQVRGILSFLFSISRGHYRFEPNDEPIDDDLMLDLPIQQILLDGIRSMKDPLAIRVSVGSMTDVLYPSQRGGEGRAELNPAEAYLLSRIDGTTSVLDLLSLSPMSEVETLRSLCALLSVGIVSAKAPSKKTHPKHKTKA